ncbi:hypothetical protein G6F68_017986 [Rhizopus microsporus]|nr:hypothetical protein G6F68_017986 [Rhizopus microsporus]
MKTASVMASYSVIDHCERYIGPNVITFHPDGSKIYCGYENMIEIFDVHRPGNESDKIPTIPTLWMGCMPQVPTVKRLRFMIK